MDEETDFDTETTLFNESSILPAAESLFSASGDLEKYKTSPDSFRCTIMLEINEFNRDIVSDLFDKVYEVDFGLYVFADKDTVRDTSEDSIKNSFEMYLPPSVYDNDFDDDLSN